MRIAIKTFLLFLLAGTFFTAAAQPKSMGPKCEIRKKFVDGKVAVDYVYNRGGKVMEERYYKEGKVHHVRKATDYAKSGYPTAGQQYDADGNLTSRMELDLDKNNLVAERRMFEVDKKGKSKLIRKIKYINDPKSPCKLQGLSHYGPDDKLLYRSEIKYIDRNCSSVSSVYGPDGKQIRTETWTRDAKLNPLSLTSPFHYQEEHNLIDLKVVDADGTVSDDDTYVTDDPVYNEYGFLQEATYKYKNGDVKKVRYEYYCK